MEEHYISIDDKFMRGIEKDKIIAVIFNECPVETTITPGDKIFFKTTKSHFTFSKYCTGVKLLQQTMLRDLNPKQFGFITSDLLIDDLCNRFRYNPDKNNLYYVLYLGDKPPRLPQWGHYIPIIPTLSWNEKINTTYVYNPEYDDTPWRD